MTAELRPGVWHLALRGVNAYLVEDGDALTLVDAGMPWQAGEIRRQLEVAGFSMRDVDRVLVTHYDLDHVGGLRSLLDGAGDVEVYCGARDADVLAGRRKPPWDNRKGVFQRLTGVLVPSVRASIRAVDDGDRIGGFEAIHAPGHTPGHTVFVHEGLETAMLGDLVREDGGELEPSPALLSYDTDEVAESIRRVLDRAPDFEVACVGHGDPLRARGREALVRLSR
ncbi:MBL fold metallo-hydrolase [Halobacterium litoreum]|uniref:MBL fold metallo-hydrolase n=1 Tax=Halobacterium litoreum TaxID=2039234 RepID=A0ABD5ND54_9EURY|nr:MBL fold metallo-hydrolase [Halobacterium litoreum]UHH13871.1 MBL fold metallo-hydrolase [Halobacterium litoreum]